MECHRWTSKPWKEHKYPEIQPTNLCGVCSGYGIVDRIGFRPCVRNRSMGDKRETHIRCRQQIALLPESLRRRLHRFGKCGCWHCSAASAASAAKTCKNPWIKSINCTTSGPPPLQLPNTTHTKQSLLTTWSRHVEDISLPVLPIALLESEKLEWWCLRGFHSVSSHHTWRFCKITGYMPSTTPKARIS